MVDRDKDSFTYPLHKHEEMELNFVEHCDGARRIVGDSIEVLGQYDLVLMGSGLEHAWDQHDCTSHSIHEITIQFRQIVDFCRRNDRNRRYNTYVMKTGYQIAEKTSRRAFSER